MKNNAECVAEINYPRLFKTIITVKLIVIFTLVLNLSVIGSTIAQNERATLNMKSVNIGHVLKEIETQTKYRFVYGEDLMDGLGSSFDIAMEDRPVKEILQNILAGTELSYS